MLLALFTFALPTQATAEPIRILALGDSLSAGYGLLRGDAFPSQLEQALKQKGLDVRVENAGVSGDTSAGGLSRLDWALKPGFDAAIVELGANDGLRGLDPQETLNNLDAILAKLRQQNLAVLLTGMRAPPNLGPDYGHEFAAIYPSLAEKHGVALYPFFLDGVAAIADLNQDDTIHPNGAGVKIIVERMLPSVMEMLQEVRP